MASATRHHAADGIGDALRVALTTGQEIAEGGIGTILSATLYSSRSKGNTCAVPAWTAYTHDRSTGAGLARPTTSRWCRRRTTTRGRRSCRSGG